MPKGVDERVCNGIPYLGTDIGAAFRPLVGRILASRPHTLALMTPSQTAVSSGRVQTVVTCTSDMDFGLLQQAQEDWTLLGLGWLVGLRFVLEISYMNGEGRQEVGWDVCKPRVRCCGCK